LHASRCEKLDDSHFKENLFCSIPLSNSGNLLLGVIYHSPNSNEINDVNLRQLISAAVGLVSNTKHLMITGDLNYLNIDWDSWSASDGDSGSNLFIEALKDDFLFQHVTFPTRARNGQGPSILDLIITYDGNVTDNLTATDPLGKSDHYMLEYEYVCSCD